jgi:cytochrome c oxidase subunit 4
MDTSEADLEREAHVPAWRHVVCWIALLSLTIATYSLSSINLGEWSLLIALCIAVAKSAVVVLFFMHLWETRGANRLVFVAAIVFIALLIGGILSDVVTRFPPALPPR